MSDVVAEAAEGAVVDILNLHYRECVRRFLRTVVVVDDRAYSSRLSTEVEAVETPLDPLAGLTLTAVKADSEPEALVLDKDHELDGPSLVRLFARRGIVCSIIEPPKDLEAQSLVDEIKIVAHAADVLVLDWELRHGDHTASLAAITQLVEEDSISGGRLRFVVVYTAAPQRIVKQAICGAFGKGVVAKDGHLLRVGSACIVVLNKPAIGYSNAVPLEKLPDAILDHHAKFSAGILPSAALSAIGTIRNHTHQVLGQFHGQLDAAFIAHRALIPRPEDAEMHLIELVADSLHHLMLAEGVRAHLSDELCIARLKELPAVKEIGEPALSLIISCISGFNANKIGVVRQALNLQQDDSYPEKRFIEALYGHQGTADARRKEMAFLHDFTRSHLQKTVRDNPPRLTLGTIVAIPRGETYEYQLCIQPRCDSVRFERVRAFPFTRLLDSEHPNVHLHWGGAFRGLSSSEKLFDIKTHNFGRELEATTAVHAHFDPDAEKWYFQDSLGARLYWVGDLRKDKAQRMASKIASRLHMPGINEYEPTRQPD